MAEVLWLGGAPDAGKSTVARILTRRYRLGHYSLDKHGRVHLEQLANADPARYQPVLDTFPAGRLAELTPAEHLDWTLSFARDRFPLLLKDLREFEGRRPILVEGAGLLPKLVKPLLLSSRQAIWLIPSEAFILANWSRSKKRFLAQQAADPDRPRG